MARWHQEENDTLFKVVYICSNQSIASQNIQKLYDGATIDGVSDTRLSMQHLKVFEQENDAKVLEKYIQLIPLTPATSFNMTNSSGSVIERALMFALLRRLDCFVGILPYFETMMIDGAYVSWNSWGKSYYEERVLNCGDSYISEMTIKLREHISQELIKDIHEQCKKIKDNSNNFTKGSYQVIYKLRQIFAKISIELEVLFMKIDINKLTTNDEVVNDFVKVMERLDELGELFVFQNNKARCVLSSIGHYEALVDGDSNITNDNNPVDDVVQTLNKIGKQIFVDYYYVFKDNDTPEDKLPKEFTLNSKRSRTSSARKLFRENKNINALEVIIKSDRLDENIINKAKAIFEDETIANESSDVVANDNIQLALGLDKEIKIGRFVRNSLRNMIQNNKISANEIANMTNAKYSKDMFNLNFPVLKEVVEDLNFDQQKKDSKGYNRYYDLTIDVNSKRYLLCSQWVENLHRSSFKKWLALLGK